MMIGARRRHRSCASNLATQTIKILYLLEMDSLVRALCPFTWMTCSVLVMRLCSLTADTLELGLTTVSTMRMLGSSASQVYSSFAIYFYGCGPK